MFIYCMLLISYMSWCRVGDDGAGHYVKMVGQEESKSMNSSLILAQSLMHDRNWAVKYKIILHCYTFYCRFSWTGHIVDSRSSQTRGGPNSWLGRLIFFCDALLGAQRYRVRWYPAHLRGLSGIKCAYRFKHLTSPIFISFVPQSHLNYS